MATRHRILVKHAFKGGRFVDHGLDVDVLVELSRYKALITEAAKEIWRRKNPDRDRLPRNFEDSLALRLYEITPGSVVVPLERTYSKEYESLFGVRDELDEAVALVDKTIAAGEADDALPQEFPKQLLGCFSDYGKSLRPDEWIELTREGCPATRYDQTVQQRLTAIAMSPYDALVDVVGTVTMARVNRPRMAVQLDDGREVKAAFDPTNETMIITALKEHQHAKVRLLGRGNFSPDGRLERITDVAEVRLLQTGEEEYDSNAKPIWEEFEEISQTISPALAARLPVDGAEQHDHYIYGSPKRLS